MKGKRKTAIRKKAVKLEKETSPTNAQSAPAEVKMPTAEKTTAAPPVMTVEAIPTAESLTTPGIAETPPQNPPPPPEPAPDQVGLAQEPASALDHKNNFLFIVGLVVFLVVIVGTGLFAAFLFTSQRAPAETAETDITAQPSPSPEPEEEALDRDKFVFEVLNGSGVSGAAAKVKSALEDLGYVVVKTGNADNQNYTATEIYLSENLADISKQLLEDLASEFEDATYSGLLEPDEDSTISAQLIVGKTE